MSVVKWWLEAINRKNQTGVMVAFLVPKGTANGLALGQDTLPTGSEPLPPDDLHLTLAFLGAASEMIVDRLEVLEALALFAAQQPPLTGRLNGLGAFTAQGGKYPLYMNFDCAALPEFRQDLIAALAAAGVEVNGKHGFTPHVTLAYVPEGVEVSGLAVPDKKVTFDRIGLFWGGQVEFCPLKGDVTMSTRANEGVRKLTDVTSHRVAEAVIDEKRTSDGGFLLSGVVIAEGMSANGNLYTLDALKSGIVVFRDRAIYADHPSRSEESDRPERSVRDLVGRLSESEDDFWVERNKHGTNVLRFKNAKLSSTAGWLATMIKERIAGDMSINAMGSGEDIDGVFNVLEFTEATSLDFVTVAAAGGLGTVAEGSRLRPTETDLPGLTLTRLAAARPDLVNTIAARERRKAYGERDEFRQMRRRVKEQEEQMGALETARQRAEAEATMERVLASSGLPGPIQKAVRGMCQKAVAEHLNLPAVEQGAGVGIGRNWLGGTPGQPYYRFDTGRSVWLEVNTERGEWAAWILSEDRSREMWKQSGFQSGRAAMHGAETQLPLVAAARPVGEAFYADVTWQQVGDSWKASIQDVTAEVWTSSTPDDWNYSVKQSGAEVGQGKNFSSSDEAMKAAEGAMIEQLSELEEAHAARRTREQAFPSVGPISLDVFISKINWESGEEDRFRDAVAARLGSNPADLSIEEWWSHLLTFMNIDPATRARMGAFRPLARRTRAAKTMPVTFWINSADLEEDKATAFKKWLKDKKDEQKSKADWKALYTEFGKAGEEEEEEAEEAFRAYKVKVQQEIEALAAAAPLADWSELADAAADYLGVYNADGFTPGWVRGIARGVLEADVPVSDDAKRDAMNALLKHKEESPDAPALLAAEDVADLLDLFDADGNAPDWLQEMAEGIFEARRGRRARSRESGYLDTGLSPGDVHGIQTWMLDNYQPGDMAEALTDKALAYFTGDMPDKVKVVELAEPIIEMKTNPTVAPQTASQRPARSAKPVREAAIGDCALIQTYVNGQLHARIVGQDYTGMWAFEDAQGRRHGVEDSDIIQIVDCASVGLSHIQNLRQASPSRSTEDTVRGRRVHEVSRRPTRSAAVGASLSLTGPFFPLREYIVRHWGSPLGGEQRAFEQWVVQRGEASQLYSEDEWNEVLAEWEMEQRGGRASRRRTSYRRARAREAEMSYPDFIATKPFDLAGFKVWLGREVDIDPGAAMMKQSDWEALYSEFVKQLQGRGATSQAVRRRTSNQAMGLDQFLREAGVLREQWETDPWIVEDQAAYERAAQELERQGYSRRKGHAGRPDYFEKWGEPAVILTRPLATHEWTPKPMAGAMRARHKAREAELEIEPGMQIQLQDGRWVTVASRGVVGTTVYILEPPGNVHITKLVFPTHPEDFQAGRRKAEDFRNWLTSKNVDPSTTQAPQSFWQGMWKQYCALTGSEVDAFNNTHSDWVVIPGMGLKWRFTYYYGAKQGIQVMDTSGKIWPEPGMVYSVYKPYDPADSNWQRAINIVQGKESHRQVFRRQTEASTGWLRETTPPPDVVANALRDAGFSVEERGFDVIASLNRGVTVDEVWTVLMDHGVDRPAIRQQGDVVIVTTSYETRRPAREQGGWSSGYSPSDYVEQDARGISSGTMATLTGYKTFTDLDAVQLQFVQFVQQNPGPWKNWMRAWAAFAQGHSHEWPNPKPITAAIQAAESRRAREMRRIRRGDNWWRGVTDGYAWTAQAWDEPGRFGINSGRVSKLVVYPGSSASGRAIYEYDRGPGRDEAPPGLVARIVGEIEARVPPYEDVMQASQRRTREQSTVPEPSGTIAPVSSELEPGDPAVIELPPDAAELPEEAQMLWLETYITYLDGGEEQAMHRAWSAVYDDGWEKDESGRWIKTQTTEMIIDDTGGVSDIVSLPEEESVRRARRAFEKKHTAAWHRCVDEVKKGGGKYNPYAVCTWSIDRPGGEEVYKSARQLAEETGTKQVLVRVAFAIMAENPSAVVRYDDKIVKEISPISPAWFRLIFADGSYEVLVGWDMVSVYEARRPVAEVILTLTLEDADSIGDDGVLAEQMRDAGVTAIRIDTETWKIEDVVEEGPPEEPAEPAEPTSEEARRPVRATVQDMGGGKWRYSTKKELAERIGMFQASEFFFSGDEMEAEDVDGNPVWVHFEQGDSGNVIVEMAEARRPVKEQPGMTPRAWGLDVKLEDDEMREWLAYVQDQQAVGPEQVVDPSTLELWWNAHLQSIGISPYEEARRPVREQGPDTPLTMEDFSKSTYVTVSSGGQNGMVFTWLGEQGYSPDERKTLAEWDQIMSGWPASWESTVKHAWASVAKEGAYRDRRTREQEGEGETEEETPEVTFGGFVKQQGMGSEQADAFRAWLDEDGMAPNEAKTAEEWEKAYADFQEESEAEEEPASEEESLRGREAGREHRRSDMFQNLGLDLSLDEFLVDHPNSGAIRETFEGWLIQESGIYQRGGAYSLEEWQRLMAAYESRAGRGSASRRRTRASRRAGWRRTREQEDWGTGADENEITAEEYGQHEISVGSDRAAWLFFVKRRGIGPDERERVDFWSGLEQEWLSESSQAGSPESLEAKLKRVITAARAEWGGQIDEDLVRGVGSGPGMPGDFDDEELKEAFRGLLPDDALPFVIDGR